MRIASDIGTLPVRQRARPARRPGSGRYASEGPSGTGGIRAVLRAGQRLLGPQGASGRGHQNLIGSDCDAWIPAQRPRKALEARPRRANQAACGGYVHEIPNLRRAAGYARPEVDPLPAEEWNERGEPRAAGDPVSEKGPPMPLLDHFNPPLNRTHPWRSFHGAWAAAMARLLNQGVLPSGYYAVPLVDRDGPIEIDVAALREQGAPVPASGTAWPQTWVAPAPVLAVAVDLPAVDGVEVQVFADDGDPRLAAAVELLSPRNKDRPAARQAFAVKCVGYLQQGSSVVVVDTVTTRRADLNGTILSLLGVDVGAAALPLSSLSAVSYRAVGREEEPQQLQLWPASLALAQPLPTLPLWIASDFSVPLDLEASYQMTCADLRIRQAG